MESINEYLTNRSEKDELTGCIVWKLSVANHGYGQAYWPAFSKNKSGTISAHRLAYRAWCGEIPTGLLVLHKCDNRRCINPEHLFLGTNKDNSDDKIGKGRCNYGDHHGRAISASLQNSGRAFLTPEDVRAIRRTPQTHKSLAKKYGVHRTVVTQVKNGKSYRWVD